MIRTDAEYRRQQRELSEQAVRIDDQEDALRREGLSDEELTRAMAPVRSFHAGLREELELYRRLKEDQDLEAVLCFDTVGKQLIALRILRGVTQRELAKRLGVHESQVSRDERNEYHGITDERASLVLKALRVKVERKYTIDSDEQISAATTDQDGR